VLDELRDQVVLPGDRQARVQEPHVGIPLAGRFKARSQQVQKILVFVAAETDSGLKPGAWTRRLIVVLRDDFQKTTGFLFVEENGEQRKMSSFDDAFYEKLLQVRDRQPELFTPGIDLLEDYHLARSLRRGVTTRATNAGVSETDIDWMNRWNVGGEDASSGPLASPVCRQGSIVANFLEVLHSVVRWNKRR